MDVYLVPSFFFCQAWPFHSFATREREREGKRSLSFQSWLLPPIPPSPLDVLASLSLFFVSVFFRYGLSLPLLVVDGGGGGGDGGGDGRHRANERRGRVFPRSSFCTTGTFHTFVVRSSVNISCSTKLCIGQAIAKVCFSLHHRKA